MPVTPMRSRCVSELVRCTVLAILVACVVAWPAAASADLPSAPPPTRGGPWTLELSLDHGVGLFKPAGERWEAPSVVGSLDARLHGGLGLGAMVRVGLLQLAFSRFELETGPTFRGWLVREGPRGLALGGGLGLSLALRFDPPRPGPFDGACVLDPAAPDRCRSPYDGRAGAFVMVHLDYREHGFFVGLAALGRWLPHDLRSQERWTRDFAVDAILRVGGEVVL